MKRGDRVKHAWGFTGTMLGPEDFEGYSYNYPGPKWELVLWDIDGRRGWVGRDWLTVIES